MDHSTAERRLVKSPPELWAEVSSEVALGRRLAEFGVIRITRVEPETTVAWEGDRASGTVELAPAGWGTKVILTATPLAGPAPADAAAGVTDADLPAPAARRPAAQPPDLAPDARIAVAARSQPAEPAPGAESGAAEPAPGAASGAAEPPVRRRGFFARLFRRRPKAAPREPEAATLGIPGAPVPAPDPSPPAPAPDPSPPVPAPDPSPPAPGPDPTPPGPGPAPTGPTPVPDPAPPAPDPDPPPSIGTPPDPPPVAAAIRPPLDANRTVAILTEVLDDLGAAHHRPFSRG